MNDDPHTRNNHALPTSLHKDEVLTNRSNTPVTSKSNIIPTIYVTIMAIPPSSAAHSLAIDPVALITTECISVTSAMRKHTRWAQSSVSSILGRGSPVTVTTPAFPGSRPSTLREGFASRKVKGEQDFSVSRIEENEDIGLANRWGLRGKRGKSIQDNPLMSAFSRLRSDLTGCEGSANSMTYNNIQY